MTPFSSIFVPKLKTKKGNTNVDVVHADNTGVYVEEGRIYMQSFLVFGIAVKSSATLIKLNKSFGEEYRIDYKNQLKDRTFEEFFFIQNKAYILASLYNKKEQQLQIMAAEINKKDGKVISDFKEITSLTADAKKNDIYKKFAYNADSTKMIMVTTDNKADKSNIVVEVFDANLKKVGKTISIINPYDPKTYQLEDVIYTSNANVVMVARIYEFQAGKKKKAKHLDFLNYNIQIYATDGKRLKEINTAINGKWLVSSKVAQLPNTDLVIAAFYNNEKKAKEINGLMVERINPATGAIISTSLKEINRSMLAPELTNEVDEEETKQERKEREKFEKKQAEEEAFSNDLRFSNFTLTNDGGIVIMAEKYKFSSWTDISTYQGASSMRTVSITTNTYESGDILMSKMNADGTLAWLNVLPKNQREITGGGNFAAGYDVNFAMGYSYFIGYRAPYFAGFSTMPLAQNNSLAIILKMEKKMQKLRKQDNMQS